MLLKMFLFYNLKNLSILHGHVFVMNISKTTLTIAEIQKLLYQGYILPLIDYGSNTWGTTSKYNIERISKLQKRAARIILKTDYNTPSPEMFAELGWPTVPNRHNYNKAVLTYKALNNLTPEYISDLIKPLSETHTRNLR